MSVRLSLRVSDTAAFRKVWEGEVTTGHLFVPGAKGLALLDPVTVALELQGAPLALEIPGEVVAVVREGQGPQPGVGLRVQVPKHLPPIAAHIIEGRWSDAAALLLMQAVEEPQPMRRSAGARSGSFPTLERPPSAPPPPAASASAPRAPSSPSGAGGAPYSRPFQRATPPSKPDEAKPIRAARPLQHSIPAGARAIMEVEPGSPKFPRVSTNPQTPPPPPPSGAVTRLALPTPDEVPARVKAATPTPSEGLPGASTALSRAPADPKKEERKKAGDPAKIGAEAAAYLKRSEGANHYKLLGLEPQADARAVRQAYSALMMRFHPDNYYRKLDKGAQDTLEILYQRITEAYETLAVAEERTAYDMKIGNYKGSGGEGNEQERKQQMERWRQTSFESSNPKQAKMGQELYAEARKAWEKGRGAEAVAKLKLALQVHPHHVEAKALLAQAEQG